MWLLSLAIECGPSQGEAEELKDQLQGVQAFSTPLLSRADAYGAQWVLCPLNETLDNEGELPSERALHYLALLKGRSFRFALAGLEVDEARHWHEVCEDAARGELPAGLLLSAESYMTLGEPPGLVPFEGHWLMPFRR